jgi:hypothetical protein
MASPFFWLWVTLGVTSYLFIYRERFSFSHPETVKIYLVRGTVFMTELPCMAPIGTFLGGLSHVGLDSANHTTQSFNISDVVVIFHMGQDQSIVFLATSLRSVIIFSTMHNPPLYNKRKYSIIQHSWNSISRRKL